jgi:predicted GIY-YIG superfamily endonuclease
MPKPTAHHGAMALPRPPPPPVGRAFCCYVLGSDSAGWAGPYTGKTCDLRRRLHRHNNPSARSRAYSYTKRKGSWRVAAAVFGLRTNRQSVWLERALKRHSKRRARPVGLSAVQSAALAAVHVASRPSLWWAGSDSPPALHVHVFRRALQPTPRATSPLSEAQLRSAARVTATSTGEAAGVAVPAVHCHPHRDFLAEGGG